MVKKRVSKPKAGGRKATPRKTTPINARVTPQWPAPSAPERALTKPEMISLLTRSPHQRLEDYVPGAAATALSDPDFFARLIAWNHVKGEIRDAKVALPLIAVTMAKLNHAEGRALAEHALAHLADLDPRTLAKGLFARTIYEKVAKGQPPKPPVVLPPFHKHIGAPQRVLRRFIARYLRDLADDRRSFERTAVQHRHTLHELYAHFRVPRAAWVGEVLFHGEKGQPKVYPADGTVFGKLRALHTMDVEQAAGTIVKYHIPFLIARGALGKKATDPDTVLALIKAMSPTELVTNTKWLEKLGLKTVPALRSAFEAALGAAVTKTKKAPRSTLKTTVAAEVMEAAGETELSGKLRVLQEKQLDAITTVEGDWLVLGDKSGSMATAMEMATQIAALLARMVKGRVFLVFFDTSPRFYEVTAYTYEQLKALVGTLRADGGTSIGCGLQAMLEKGLKVDGIAIVSDAGENTAPYFGAVYAKYSARLGVEPTVYLYQTEGDPDSAFSMYCKQHHLDVQRFDVRHGKVDQYSLPNLVQSMRVGRYSLLDEILAYPLRTLDEVLTRTTGMPVLPLWTPEAVTA